MSAIAVAFGVLADVAPQSEIDANDPLRHFAAADYCIAKSSIDHLVGAAKERERH
jgi:hypothetical protein